MKTINITNSEDGRFIVNKVRGSGVETYEYDDIEELLQCEFLRFCCCGIPELSIKYVYNVLKCMQLNRDDTQKKFDELAKVFKTKEEQYFAYYAIDNMGLTDHGGQVPGWLTPKGEEFIKLYEEFFVPYNNAENEGKTP